MSRILTLSAAGLVLAGAAAAQGTGDYPADAAPGSCYARVLIPETYEIQTEQVLDQPEQHDRVGVHNITMGDDAAAGCKAAAEHCDAQKANGH